MNSDSKGSGTILAESLKKGTLPIWCKEFAEGSSTGRSMDRVRNLLKQLGYRKSSLEDESLLMGCKITLKSNLILQLSNKLLNIDENNNTSITAAALSELTSDLIKSLLVSSKNTQLSETASKLILLTTRDMFTHIIIPVLVSGSIPALVDGCDKIDVQKRCENKNKTPPSDASQVKKIKLNTKTEEERCLTSVLERFPIPIGEVKGFSFGDHFDCVHPKKPTHWNTIMGIQGPLIADTKYDGERLLIHRKGQNDYAFYSRNRFPIPEKKTKDIITVLDDALQKFSTCVLDSEIISEFTFGGAVGGIDKTTLIKKPLLFVFDIMYLCETCISHVPLRVRKMLLNQLLTVVNGRIQVGEYKTVSGTATQKRDVLMHSMDGLLKKRMEGLVVKPADSPYVFGNKTTWIKIKRGYLDFTDKLPTIPAQQACKVFQEFMEGESDRLFGKRSDPIEVGNVIAPAYEKVGNLPNTVDCAVVGCRFNDGDSLPESLLLGLWDPRKSRFCTLCYASTSKVNISILKSMWKIIKKTMFRIDRKKSKVPRHAAIHENNLPDMCIESAKRCSVIEIDGERFEESWEHSCDFISVIKPIIVRLREDKDLGTLTPMNELIEMYTNSAANKTTFNPNAQCDDIGGMKPTANQLLLLKPASAKQLLTLTTTPSITSIRVLTVSVAVVGRWSQKGVMKSINKLFGPSVQKSYEQISTKSKLGDVHFIKVSNSGSGGDVFVCLLLCQKYTNNNPVIPKLDIPSWELCIRKLGRFCQQQTVAVEVHLAAPAPPVPNANWEVMKEVVEKFILSKEVRIVNYLPSDIGV